MKYPKGFCGLGDVIERERFPFFGFEMVHENYFTDFVQSVR